MPRTRAEKKNEELHHVIKTLFELESLESTSDDPLLRCIQKQGWTSIDEMLYLSSDQISDLTYVDGAGPERYIHARDQSLLASFQAFFLHECNKNSARIPIQEYTREHFCRFRATLKPRRQGYRGELLDKGYISPHEIHGKGYISPLEAQHVIREDQPGPNSANTIAEPISYTALSTSWYPRLEELDKGHK